MTGRTRATLIDGTLDGEVVNVSVRIAAPPELVFEFLSERDKLLRWMGQDAKIDARTGGVFWLDVNGSDKAAGEYVEIDPPRHIAFTWGWEGSDTVPPGSSLVTIDLRVDGEDTIVELSHSGLPAEARQSHLDGWCHHLPNLAL
jgi:uncharacterized protein YndB with AHSA1/START domain